MDYIQEKVIIKEIHDDRVMVLPAEAGMEDNAGCAGCKEGSGCGVCSSKPGLRPREVATDTSTDFAQGEIALLNTIQLPFILSLLCVFVLPLILMVAFPALGSVIAAGRGVSQGDGMIVLEALLGFISALIFNTLLDRYLAYKYPPVIQKADGK